MLKKSSMQLTSLLLAAVTTACLFSGCAADRKEKDDSISVYLWSSSLYQTYAPYIQSRLPDVDIEFVVGNNDLDFYKFMQKNGALPDIITCRRFSLHDAAGLQTSLMDLSTTEEAGTIYEAYLDNFRNTDGSINWLPLCGEVDGLVANRELFEQYGVSMPADYDSFVSACQAFEARGIRGFAADFAYDYTCMELLQALVIPELSSLEGQMWRHAYEEPTQGTNGLDDQIWPVAFQRMEQLIADVHLRAEDVELSFNPVVELFQTGQAAMIRSGGADVIGFQKQGIDAVFLPYCGRDAEQWLLTYPAFQVALNRDLEKNADKKAQAMEVLKVMLCEEGQNVLAKGGDVITYSQNVKLALSPMLENLTPYIQQNHLYIRIASNDFFSASADVVQKMLRGEYNAAQAYEAFDAQLKQPADAAQDTVLSPSQGYSNEFHKKGGNASASVMANTLRTLYGTDVLIAPAYSFTGSVLKAEYSEEMVGNMIMPNSLEAWQREMSGAELKEYLKISVEGFEGGFVPFNRGALPSVSGLSIEVKEAEGTYSLVGVRKDGREIADGDTFRVTCLNTAVYMDPWLKDESRPFQQEEQRVKKAWTAYITEGGTLAQPENYITLN